MVFLFEDIVPFSEEIIVKWKLLICLESADVFLCLGDGEFQSFPKSKCHIFQRQMTKGKTRAH